VKAQLDKDAAEVAIGLAVGLPAYTATLAVDRLPKSHHHWEAACQVHRSYVNPLQLTLRPHFRPGQTEML
jgi:hypothetical protein